MNALKLSFTDFSEVSSRNFEALLTEKANERNRLFLRKFHNEITAIPTNAIEISVDLPKLNNYLKDPARRTMLSSAGLQIKTSFNLF